MAEIINLRRARKRVQRLEGAQEAAENRVWFGRTRSERHTEEMAAEQADRTLDGAKVEPVNQAAGGNAPDAKRAKDRDTTS